MIVRPAGPADADAVLAFWRAYAEPSLTDTRESTAAVIAHPTAVVLLAEEGDVIVGTVIAAWDGWRGNLYHLAVAEDRRRQGIASSLVAEAEQWLAGHYARRLSALVIDDHDYAVRTWEAAGFRRTDGMGRYFKMLG